MTVTRAFTLDEAGTIVKLTITTTGGSTTYDGTYLVTYNGHGDALTFEKIETSGSLTVANRFSYSTWGAPRVDGSRRLRSPEARRQLGGGMIAEMSGECLRRCEGDVCGFFRGMYAGSSGSRHYSPELGRFLQPEPDRSEANLYAYAAPATAASS